MEDIIAVFVEATNQDILVWASPTPADLMPNLKYVAGFNSTYIFKFFGSVGGADRLQVIQDSDLIAETGSGLADLVSSIQDQLSRRHTTQISALKQLLQDALP